LDFILDQRDEKNDQERVETIEICTFFFLTKKFVLLSTLSNTFKKNPIKKLPENLSLV